MGERVMLVIASSMVVFFKLIVIILGYKTIKLGYDLLLRGVKGEFKFSSEISGYKADLRSASPGLLFVVLGCVIMVIAVIEKFPQEVERSSKDLDKKVNSFEKPRLKQSDRSL